MYRHADNVVILIFMKPKPRLPDFGANLDDTNINYNILTDDT